MIYAKKHFHNIINTMAALGVMNVFNIHVKRLTFYAGNLTVVQQNKKIKQKKNPQSTCNEGTYILVTEKDNIKIINL